MKLSPCSSSGLQAVKCMCSNSSCGAARLSRANTAVAVGAQLRVCGCLCLRQEAASWWNNQFLYGAALASKARLTPLCLLQLVTAVQRLQGGSSTHVLLHAAGTVQQLSAL